MDFSFTPEQHAWRKELRDFLAREFDESLSEIGDHVGSDEGWARAMGFTKKMAARNWLAVGWPQEYGGPGRSHIDQLIFKEEMAYHRAPDVSITRIGFFGPTLMVYGSEEQKKRYLPKILSAEEIWCQGLSEPEAGS